MGTPKVINRETRWNDSGQGIDIPAGEKVLVVGYDEMPLEERWVIERSIETYAKRGRKCVPIRIRDWFALIDEAYLSDELATLKVDSLAKAKKLTVPPGVSGSKKGQKLFAE